MDGRLSKRELNENLHSRFADVSNLSFLSKSDKEDALDVLADSFKDDPLFTWVAGLEADDPKKDLKMYNLCRIMHAWVNHRLFNRTRGVAVGIRCPNDELVGCMTLAPSSCARERAVDNIIAAIKYGLPPMYKSKEKGKYCRNSQKRLEKLDVLTKIRRRHMRDTKKWIYLQAIGVRPEEHGKGYGKKMLQLLNQTADSLGVSVYLETESANLVAMYKHFGFRTVEELTLCVRGDTSPTANFTMYLMRRDPA